MKARPAPGFCFPTGDHSWRVKLFPYAQQAKAVELFFQLLAKRLLLVIGIQLVCLQPFVKADLERVPEELVVHDGGSARHGPVWERWPIL